MLVSVIMPVYNGEKYIAEAIDSVLSQTFQDFELLIINDCSTDGTMSVIETYSDRRIRVIYNESNLGLASVRNVGIDNAKGKYIAWLDSDDISLDTRLAKQVNLLENNPRIGMCGTWVKTIGSAEHIWEYPTESEKIKSTMLFSNCFATSSVILRKEVLISYKIHFNTDLQIAEDYDMWEHVSQHCEIANIPEILTLYRLHDYQTTSSNEAKSKIVHFAWKTQERMLASINIFPNQQEKEIHLKLGLQSDSKIVTREDVMYIYDWLLKLYVKNLEYKRFSNKAFKQNLNNELYTVCNVSNVGLVYFYHSAFRIFGLRYIYRIIKLFIKNLINYQFSFKSRIKRRLAVFGYWLGKSIFKKDENTKCQIYFFIPWYHVGGGERVHLDIVTAIKSFDPKVIFTNESKNDFFLNDFKQVSDVYEHPLIKNKYLRFFFAGVWAADLNRKKNVIIFNCSSEFFYDMLPLVNKNIKIVDLLHSFTNEGVDRYSVPFVNYIDKRIVITPTIKSALIKQYENNYISEKLIDRIKIIENGVEIPNFEKKYLSDDFRVLYVGRGSKDKRVHLVGQVASKCKKVNIDCNFTLIGDVENNLRSEEKKNCQFIGETRNVSKYYRESDILLITSTTEGFPMVVMEAMAYGMIPICTDVGGIGSHITNEKNGFLVDNTNEEDIVNQMVDIIKSLSLDKKKKILVSKRAKAYAKCHFDKKIFIRNYNNFIKELCMEKHI